MRLCALCLSCIALLALAPGASALAQSPVDARWMWFDEGDPASDAPAGPVWFRREVRATEPSTGAVRIVCDDRFVLWVNGQRVGEGDRLAVYRFNLNGIVERGPNVIAIEAVNQSGKAGLLVDGEIRGQGGNAISFDSSSVWAASRTEPASAWLQPGFDAADWTAAKDLGPHPESPWQDITFEESYLDRYQVPPGFRLERIAEPELAGSLVAITWGGRGRLIASREGGPIQSLIDTNGDGTFDEARQYSPDVTNCQGLCQVFDDLYAVGNGPDGTGVYRLPDRDHDDVADEVQLVLRHRGGMGEHGPHDVVFGPDGWLYHNLGNHAWVPSEPEPTSPVRNPYEGDLLQPRFEDGNGHAAGIKVPGGTIWRFAPDGSRWWLETAGFRNEYDIAFNALGDLYTFDSDMEWDVGQPWYRPVRVNHCIPGAEFGWRSGTAKWPVYYFDSLPGTADIGRGSPTGVLFYEHHQFPERYQGALLVCDWSMGRIIAVHLEPDGATFRGTWDTLVSGNPLNVSDIEVDRDGSLVFATGGRGTEGGVYRVTYGQHQAVEPASAKTIDELLRLPQPQAAWAREIAAKLKVKVGRNWRRDVVEHARTGSPAEQTRALSLLSQHGPRPGVDLLLDLTGDDDASVRAFACWLLGDAGASNPRSHAAIAQALSRLLGDANAQVQRRACEAFVRSGLEAPVEPLLKLLASPDRWLRFAARLALKRVPADKWREQVLTAEEPRVVVEGLLALVHVGPGAISAHQALSASLALFKAGPLEPDIRLDVLRLIELALLSGDSSEAARASRAIGELLLAEFPTGHASSDREISRMLAVLQVPESAARLVESLEQGQDQSEQLHYAHALAYLKTGWDDSLRRRLLDWYETTQVWDGGHSLRSNVDNIVAAGMARFPPEDRRQLLDSWNERPFATRLLLRNSHPEEIPGYEAVVAQMIEDVGGSAASEETVSVAIEALGKSGSREAQQLLRKLYDDHPDRREQLARVLAQHADPDNWPQLVRSLQFGDSTTMQLCLAALRKIDRRPEQSEEVRTTILAGLKLGDQGGLLAAELLESWTGSPHNGGLDAGQALAHYQQWFRDQYPDAPPAELPVQDVEKTRYTYEQLLELVEHASQSSQGDPQRGELVFAKANCIKCHRFLNKGEGIGPDLTSVRRRFQRKEIVESLVYPSQVISDQYRSVTLSTVDGQIFTGMPAVQEGSDNIVLLLADATRLEIPKAKVDEMQPSQTSVMPEGVLKELTPEEIVDLFALLETSRDNAPVEQDGERASGK